MEIEFIYEGPPTGYLKTSFNELELPLTNQLLEMCAVLGIPIYVKLGKTTLNGDLSEDKSHYEFKLTNGAMTVATCTYTEASILGLEVTTSEFWNYVNDQIRFGENN
jgi:hypothetical protein